jgi:hypothetical protein
MEAGTSLSVGVHATHLYAACLQACLLQHWLPCSLLLPASFLACMLLVIAASAWLLLLLWLQHQKITVAHHDVCGMH